jgi:hypothetical protein
MVVVDGRGRMGMPRLTPFFQAEHVDWIWMLYRQFNKLLPILKVHDCANA